MNSKLLATMGSGLLLLLSSHTYATTQQYVPAKCPSVSAIQAAGLHDVKRSSKNPDHWGVAQTSRYDTTEEWTFYVAVLQAKNEQDALSIATAALSSLKFEEGPEEGTPVLCAYSINANHIFSYAMATNPPHSANGF